MTGRKEHDSDQQPDEDESYNIFRHSLLRYAGYANEVGESFRYQAPRWVLPSYVIAFGYCCADATFAGWRAYNANYNGHKNDTATSMMTAEQQEQQQQAQQLYRNRETFRATADTLLWQSLASVMIPGATIHTIVKASRWVIRTKRMTQHVPAASAAVQWFPTVIGLCSIPVIVHPIDHAVDYLLYNTTRTWWPKPKQQKPS